MPAPAARGVTAAARTGAQGWSEQRLLRYGRPRGGGLLVRRGNDDRAEGENHEADQAGDTHGVCPGGVCDVEQGSPTILSADPRARTRACMRVRLQRLYRS
jgi:hypothetical protein